MDPDDELLQPRHCVANALQTTARRVGRLYAEALAPTGLTRIQFPILARLDARGPLPMTALAEQLHMDRTTLTRDVAPLERDGLVERPKDPADGRVRLVALTATGRARLEEARSHWRRAQEQVLDLVGREAWRSLEDALRDLRDRLP
jgi:DNA-binding MarR family transcriptional regulator